MRPTASLSQQHVLGKNRLSTAVAVRFFPRHEGCGCRPPRSGCWRWTISLRFSAYGKRLPGRSCKTYRPQSASSSAKLSLAATVRAGQTVAITAGSRGIHQIGDILQAAVDYLRDLGASPFIVPAMGSHGGGTAEGQRQVLQALGITEEKCGCPIRSSMETIIVCQAPEGFPVHFDRTAAEADHVLVCNRIKPHTGFVGDIQSGLMKMMLIGLGKHEGAKIYHRAIQDYSFGQIVRSVAQQVLQRCHIVGGLAVVENAYDQTGHIEAVVPEDLARREPYLLQLAEQWMARLPFDEADVLLINEIGKNISGTGMDTNVIGRKHNDHTAIGDERPRIKYVIVRDLTQATHGNASGIGLAEFALSRVVRAMDVPSTVTNCVTANHPTGAMIPIHFETDREVLSAALGSIGLRAPADARLIWIQNTLQLAEVEVSAAYWQAAQGRSDLQILTDLRPLPWNGRGQLPDDFLSGPC